MQTGKQSADLAIGADNCACIEEQKDKQNDLLVQEKIKPPFYEGSPCVYYGDGKHMFTERSRGQTVPTGDTSQPGEALGAFACFTLAECIISLL